MGLVLYTENKISCTCTSSTSACLLSVSLKFLLLRNTHLLPTIPYFACASCLYLSKSFQNKHQWLLLIKVVSVPKCGWCVFSHTCSHLHRVSSPPASFTSGFSKLFFFGSSLHTLAIYLSSVSYSGTSASDSVLSEKSREARDSYISLVCGHCPILVLLPWFWRRKKLDEMDGVRVLELCIWQGQPWLSVSHLCKIIKYGDEETLVFNFLKVIKPDVLNPRPANIMCMWGKKRWMDQLE